MVIININYTELYYLELINIISGYITQPFGTAGVEMEGRFRSPTTTVDSQAGSQSIGWIVGLFE